MKNMTEYEQMLNNVAKQVGCDADTLRVKADAVLLEEGSAWTSSGKTEQEASVLALRVAARRFVSEKSRLSRSGATLYEGMFLSVPREKDWSQMAYNKMKNTLQTLDESGRLALVGQGALYLYENNHDGTYTRHANPSLLNKQTFEEGVDSSEVSQLPKHIVSLDDNTSFTLVWDKTNTHFANGNANFKYGSPRPLNEPDRSCVFVGRKSGSNDEMRLHEFRFNGELAKKQWATFTTGTIGMKPSAKDTLCYGTKATEFNADSSIASSFPSPPLALDDGSQPTGIVADWLGDGLLPSLSACFDAYDTLDEKERWNTIHGTVVEVIHIDPRENGGFILTVADTDIMSPALPLEMYVSREHEGEVTFGVGSELVIVGGVWKTKEGEHRMSVSGWWCMNAIEPLADTPTDDGWDSQ